MLKDGLYEQVISELLGKELDSNHQKIICTENIGNDEAPRLLAKYIAEIVEKTLEKLRENGSGINDQIEFINNMIRAVVGNPSDAELESYTVDKRAEMLLAYLEKQNRFLKDGRDNSIIRPDSSLLWSSLFTGAANEPSMYAELKKEIILCDRIDMLVSFIKWSGLRLIIDELRSFTRNGGRLRVITTSYMGATDSKAIEKLSELENTEIKISYDTKRTRLHAKTYVFQRKTGFSTAYVGSSNLSNAAISSGLEWNVKIAEKDLPETMSKINATFESYWNSTDFEFYSTKDKPRFEEAIRNERHNGDENEPRFMFNVTPYGYQQEILDKLKAEREIHGRFKNLVVAATGTGKTVISAFDFLRFRNEHPGKTNRLLFVAHREEILKQSIACYRGILRDQNFGNLLVGDHKPDNIEDLFVSIQSFNSQDLHINISPEFYDYIVIDEFHHAAASTYQKLLSHFKPKILLGLTATPERMDGQNVVEYFENHISAEIRLPEAIERKLLSPFQYFGVSDVVDLEKLKWSRGGYDVSQLSKLYTDERGDALGRAQLIVDSVRKYVTDMDEVKGIAFCVSVEHAIFMSQYFNSQGIKSIYLTGSSSKEERDTARERLAKGDIRFICVVDIYNEGVDIPEINTILFLRPTQSLTVFLQQLGRGLRITPEKECLTVLDFIGQANSRYNFEEKFSALLSKTTKGLLSEIKDGFVNVPKGCFIQLEKIAKEHILNNIRKSIGMKVGMISRLRTFSEDSGLPLTLENFVEYYHLDPSVIYKINSFSRLCVQANVRDDFSDYLETMLAKAMKRICSIDSRRWINFLLRVLRADDGINLDGMSTSEIRMLNMFHYTIWQKPLSGCGFGSIEESILALEKNQVLFREIIDLLELNLNRIDFIDERVDLGTDVPLDLYCNYTRDQILVALDYMAPSNVREGVKYLPKMKTDVFFITLNKSDKDYSPTTLYNDYSINEHLFHWQSQSTTSEESMTGKRYINHRSSGNTILLFVRENKEDFLGASPYTYLGKAEYASHVGSNPMNIVWSLEKPIPAKYLKKTNRLVVT